MKTKNGTADFADYTDFKEAHELYELTRISRGKDAWLHGCMGTVRVSPCSSVAKESPKALVLYRRRAAPPKGTITEHGTRARGTVFLRVSSRTFAAKNKTTTEDTEDTELFYFFLCALCALCG